MERGLGRRSAVALLVVGGLVLLAGSASTPGRAWAAFPGANGKIAFVSGREDASGNFHENLYTMNMDGSVQTNLTRDRFDVDSSVFPAWSPDGNRIAFAGTLVGLGPFGITVMDANGSNGRQIASVCANRLVWSPDGRKIAFAGCAGDFEIFVVNTDGSELTRLTSGHGSSNPEWSPNGRKIAFDRFDGIYTMNADGSGQTSLTKNLHDIGFAGTPQWSPDGRKIAFAAKGGDGWALYVMNADGSDVRELASPDVGGFTWSPDGSKVAFQSGSGSTCCAISVVNVDASDLTRLTSGAFRSNPEWSPDGRKIVFTAYYEIYVMNADGSDQTDLTDPTKSADDSPRWQTVPSADLALGLTARTSTVRHGHRLTYRITLHNAGPSNAMGVVVSDHLPAETGFLSIHISQGGCSHPPLRSTGTITCPVGFQLTGTNWSARIVVETNGAKRTIRNSIRVKSSTRDPDPANNAATSIHSSAGHA